MNTSGSTNLVPPLDIRDLYFRYPPYPGTKADPVINNFNFVVDRGKVTVLFGKPDSGKTTLSRILGGLLPRFSRGDLKGSIYIGDKDILQSPPYALIRDIGLVFQNPDEQLFTTRCDSEIAFPLESLGITKKVMEQRVTYALNSIRLSQYKFRNPAYLSGGEKRRLLIACLLAIDPAFWILDEVLEEIDPDYRSQILLLLKQKKATVLIL